MTSTLPLPPDRSAPTRASNARRYQPADRFIVLVVDPEPTTSNLLAAMLHRSDVEVVESPDPADALFLAGRRAPGLVVLSAALPGLSSPEVIAAIHRYDDVPIVLSVGDGETELVGSALFAGASEVLNRPYREAEVRALLERYLADLGGRRAQLARLSVGTVELDGPAMRVTVIGRPLTLTLREFELLQLLMLNTGRVVTHDEIRDQVWRARGEDVTVRTVKVHVHRLRRHLEGAADLIAVRGIGYRLAPVTRSGD